MTKADGRSEQAKQQRKSRPRKLARPDRKMPQPPVVDVLTCKNETDLIADYLTSNLRPRVAAAFEAHMGRCGDCAAFLQTYKKTIEATRAFLRLQSFADQPKHLGLRGAKRPSR